MGYVLPALPLERLLGPLVAAETALARLDQRLATSEIQQGWTVRTDFADACAAIWLEGDLVHLEDVVLNDAEMDARAPTHTVARASLILQTRRRVRAAHAGWAVSSAGIRLLAGGQGLDDQADGGAQASNVGQGMETPTSDFDAQLADMDRALQKAQTALIEPAVAPPIRRIQPLYDEDWDEQERLGDWRSVLHQTQSLPPMLAAAVLWDAWHVIEPLQRRWWLGAYLIADVLRSRGAARYHLPAVHSWLKFAPFERRRAANTMVRILAFLDAATAASDQGRKDHDGWLLARMMLQRKLVGRRSDSRLGALIDLVIERPLVSSGVICRELKITPRAALTMIEELGLREITGRKMYRAWAVL